MSDKTSLREQQIEELVKLADDVWHHRVDQADITGFVSRILRASPALARSEAQVETRPAPPVTDGTHRWRPDPDVEGAFLCTRCNVTRRVPEGAFPTSNGCQPPSPAADVLAVMDELRGTYDARGVALFPSRHRVDEARAAVAELIEATQILIGENDIGTGMLLCERIAKARAALAKATGGMGVD